MKILRLVYEWPPPWDGLAPGPYELTKAQQKLGYDVVVFCGGGFRELGREKARLGPSRSDKLQFVTSSDNALKRVTPEEDDGLFSLPAGSLKVFRFPRALRKLSLFLTTAPSVLFGYLWLKLTGRGPDIVHGHGHITACFNIYKALFGWLDRTPYVLHLHITAAGREARLFSGGVAPNNSGCEKEAGQCPAATEDTSVAAPHGAPRNVAAPPWGARPASNVVAKFTLRKEEAEQAPQLQKKERGLPSTLLRTGKAATPKGSLDFWTRFWEWPLHKFSDWLGVQVADRVICVSTRVRDEAVKYYGADPEKLVVVENGVNTNRFAPLGGDFAAFPNPSGLSALTRRVSPAAKSILYVGALQPRKNVHLLIEALAKLPKEYCLVVVGKGDADYERKLRSRVGELNLQERVFFKAYVRYPKLPPIYQKADIFVLPSSYEGLPKVVLEALASGVPVLASGFEMEEDIQGLEFLESLESAHIADKIKRVVSSDVEVAVDDVERYYSWEKKAEEIERIYQSL